MSGGFSATGGQKRRYTEADFRFQGSVNFEGGYIVVALVKGKRFRRRRRRSTFTETVRELGGFFNVFVQIE